MKLSIYFIFVFAIAFAGCVSNDDDIEASTDIEVGETKPLTVDNLIGTWQNYYFVKKLNSKNESRVPDFDGFTITFYKDNQNVNRYFESNANGSKIIVGTFTILSANSFQLFFKSPSTHVDSTDIRRIDQFSGRRFVANKSYAIGTTLVNDMTLWRNMATMPSLYPNAPKFKLIPEKLIGEWIITASKVTLDGPLNDISNTESDNPIGKKYQIFVDKTFTEIDKYGIPRAQGTYRIVDDVIHLFYYFNSTTAISNFKKSSSSLQIKSWTTITQNNIPIEKFKVYEAFYYLGKDMQLHHQEVNQEFTRIK